VLSGRKLKFWLQASLEPTWCTSYSNFEIPLKTQESKKFEISFENFQKMIDCSKFGKRCLWKFLFKTFSDLEKSKFSLRKSLIFS
jgi:hypothetical protein